LVSQTIENNRVNKKFIAIYLKVFLKFHYLVESSYCTMISDALYIYLGAKYDIFMPNAMKES
jgi:hypothetical protein